MAVFWMDSRAEWHIKKKREHRQNESPSDALLLAMTPAMVVHFAATASLLSVPGHGGE